MRSHRKCKALICAFLGIIVCTLLVACAGGGAQGTGQQPTNTFEGRTARDASELKEYVDKATKAGEEIKAAAPKEKQDAKLTKEQQEELTNANAAYKKGDYAAAEEAYSKILKAHPTNYGANVNLALALLQQERNEDAFVQALTCMYLFPSDAGPALNAQAAGVALGFDIKDVNASVESLAKEQDSKFDLSAKSSDYTNDLTYNLLWDRIDTELHDGATGKKDTATSGYETLREELAELLHKRPDDKDVLALIAYFDAAANKLGLGPSGLLDETGNAKDDSSSSSSSKGSASDKGSSSKKSDSNSSSDKSSSSKKSGSSSSSKKSDSSSKSSK